MTPTGRRAWRRFAKQQRRKVNRKNRETGTPWINDADGAFYRHEQKHFAQRPTLPPKPFTTRSLVGMTMGARKTAVRKAQAAVLVLLKGQPADPVKFTLLRRLLYRIGERLRPCLGCCACWGHRISTAYGEYAECSGPQTNGKRKSQIKAMRKWQESLSDDCDGSGVLPARKQK